MSRDQSRRQFDAEFKREAVRLSQEPGRTLASVARDLGISETNLWRWRKQFAEGGDSVFVGTGHLSPEQEEARRLRRENANLREERDILKKALGIFSGRRR